MALVPTLYSEFHILQENKSTLFKLTNKSINSANIALLLQGIQANQSVTHYVFCLNELGDKNAVLLTKEIVQKNQVHSLYFWANQISDQGFEEIARLIGESRVAYLDLSRNFITDVGIVKGFKFLISNACFAGVDLSYNQIQPPGSKYIAKAIAKTKSLNKLNLSCNKIGQNGLVPWLYTLRNIHFLTEVNFAGNTADPSTIITLKYLANQNRKYKLKCAKALLKVSRMLLMRITPLPKDLEEMIMDQLLTAFTPAEAKILKSCLLTRCFVGWVNCNVPFAVDELVRRCDVLAKDRAEFERLAMLVGQKKNMQRKYEEILSQRTEKMLEEKRQIDFNVRSALQILLMSLLQAFYLFFTAVRKQFTK